MIACISVPYFAATVERRHGDTRPAGPGQAPGLVLGGQPWEPQPVYAFSHEAAQQGVKPGMSLRLAHVLSPEAHFMAANPPRYYDASAEVADILMDFTHLIEIETLWSPHSARSAVAHAQAAAGSAMGWRLPAAYTLDLETLPPTEALGLAREMGRQVRRQTQLAPALGLARSKFVAQVAASLTRPNHARPVMVDEEGTFLASQPVHFLPLDKEAARRLSLLGIRTLGQLAALPQSSIRPLLGPCLTPGNPASEGFAQFYRLVQEQSGRRDLGDDLFWSVKAQPSVKQERISYHFKGPVVDIQILEQALNRAATELAGRLQRAGLEGRTVQIVLEAEGAPRPDRSGADPGQASWAPTLSRRSPTANSQQLAGSLRELLSQVYREQLLPKEGFSGKSRRQELSEGIVCLTVILSDLTPAVASQLSLFNGPPVTERIREALAAILAKHKPGFFLRPILTDPQHPLPERRFQLQELTPA